MGIINIEDCGGLEKNVNARGVKRKITI